MRKSVFFICLMILVFSVSCNREEQDPALSLLREGVHLMGGEEALSSVQTIVRKGKVKVYAADGLHEGDISISIRKEPEGVLILQTFKEEEVVQGYDGHMSWHETFYSDPTATPEYNRFFHLFTLLNSGGLELSLKEKSLISLKEGEGIDSSKAVMVQLNPADHFTVYFNPATGLPGKISFEAEIGPDKKIIHYSLAYGLFKNIEGLRLPNQWTCFYDGDRIAEIEFSEIAINCPLDDSLFQMKSPGLEDKKIQEDADLLLPETPLI